MRLSNLNIFTTSGLGHYVILSSSIKFHYRQWLLLSSQFSLWSVRIIKVIKGTFSPLCSYLRHSIRFPLIQNSAVHVSACGIKLMVFRVFLQCLINFKRDFQAIRSSAFSIVPSAKPIGKFIPVPFSVIPNAQQIMENNH